MIFIRNEEIRPDQLDVVLLRVGELLRAMGAESVSSLRINCFPWRNGRRLQAVSGRDIVSVAINLPGDDLVALPGGAIVRERPDDLGDSGIAVLMGHDD